MRHITVQARLRGSYTLSVRFARKRALSCIPFGGDGYEIQGFKNHQHTNMGMGFVSQCFFEKTCDFPNSYIYFFMLDKRCSDFSCFSLVNISKWMYAFYMQMWLIKMLLVDLNA